MMVVSKRDQILIESPY